MEKKHKRKVRPITFASHLDSAIYSYYSYILLNKYEIYLEEKAISDVVAAYRKIPKENGYGGKSNIDIANDVFEFISKKLNSNENVAAITFDIKGFFDNLDHKLLKDAWKLMLGCKNMPDDVYATYKSITRYSYIYEYKLFEMFKEQIVCKTKSGIEVKKKIAKLKYTRVKGAIAYCDKSKISEIRTANIIKIRSKRDMKGIPQGLPISATLANVYMHNFDVEVAHRARKVDGLYRRYSDDIIIVCPLAEALEWKKSIMDLIKDVKLEIEGSKTNLFEFTNNDGNIVCSHEHRGVNQKLEYLGFSFDGKTKLIKNTSIGRYYCKMKKVAKYLAVISAQINNETNGKIFKNKLRWRFSHVGAKSYTKVNRSSTNPSVFTFGKRQTYGNFISYIRRASDIMYPNELNEKTTTPITKQLRRNKKTLRNCMDEAEGLMCYISSKRKPKKK